MTFKIGDRVWVKRFCQGYDACGGNDDCTAWWVNDGWVVRNGDIRGTIVRTPGYEPTFTPIRGDPDIYTISIDRYRWYHLWRPQIRARARHLELLSVIERLAEEL